VDAALVRHVWQRAQRRCEYCQLYQDHDELAFEVDHVIARKHGGATRAHNLALACFFCNAHKGPNIAGRDPATGKLTPLFNPRRHRWARHFRWKRATLVGRTPIGRTTVAVLYINDPFRIELREGLVLEGLFPPA
jgi:hypothetical protein